MSVPRKIFQTWKEKEPLRPILKFAKQSWLDQNPSYDYELWTDEENREFIAKNYGWFLPTYDSFDKNIKRVDAIRYFYLYHFGGIYADLDFICLRSFDNILEMMDHNGVGVIFGELGSDADKQDFKIHSIFNALMIAKPREDFFLFLCKAMKTLHDIKPNLGTEAQTGPIFLTTCLMFYARNDTKIVEHVYGLDFLNALLRTENTSPSSIAILEKKYFYPISWAKQDDLKLLFQRQRSIQEIKELFPDSYALTFWMHSW